MSRVRIIIAAALSAVATGAASAGFVVTLTDADGVTQSQDLPVASFPAPASDGSFTVEADFDGVSSGPFEGTVQSIDTSSARAPIGGAVSFSGTATNLQPIPVSVEVAFA